MISAENAAIYDHLPTKLTISLLSLPLSALDWIDHNLLQFAGAISAVPSACV